MGSDNVVRNAILTAFVNIGFSLPWVICYSVIYGKVDEADCTDMPYEFGHVAKWAYLASIITVAVLTPVDIRIAWDGGESSCSPFVQLLKGAHGLFSTAMWIYACVALSKRDMCQGPSADSYVKLLWATVLFPAALLGMMCCCCCFLFILASRKG